MKLRRSRSIIHTITGKYSQIKGEIEMTKKELFLGLALFMAFLLFVGTAGAREAGNISFYQFVAQELLAFVIAFVCFKELEKGERQ